MRRLGEEPLLAVDPERRAGRASASIPPRAWTAARAGQPGLAGRGLEADAVGGAAAHHEQVAGAGGRAAAVAAGVAALEPVHVEHARG